MGFPGTMGSVEMVDYILADRTVIPPDLRGFYSEKVRFELERFQAPRAARAWHVCSQPPCAVPHLHLRGASREAEEARILRVCFACSSSERVSPPNVSATTENFNKQKVVSNVVYYTIAAGKTKYNTIAGFEQRQRTQPEKSASLKI